ncbi:Esterase [Flavobacterium sp. 9AF]|uniref:alpha/beta hydrolase-fold protein n=1 Tax=Flavobacterium sp. 9AF TaxID=2653142 RepID=UPI0012EFE2A2|nr:alpha/beta hydrolase-fold protein [Flavobacterium sp. 9AF]VXB60191.1 Esterase [Flavobacterium sp. 9AF]
MKKLQITIFFISFLFLNTNLLFSQETATLKEIEFQSKVLNQKRPVYIYLPAEYDERDLVAYDVMYVFDAQHREIFDLVHSALNFITLEKKFIVVGISSPANEELEYYRNYDYLPKPINVPLEKYNTEKPNAENFGKYFSEELIQFVNNNYRTTNVNFLIGHSLSASFVLDKFLHNVDLFKGVICVSPNLRYDENRLANAFLKIDFNKPTENKFIFISQADEDITFGKTWMDANEKIKNFTEESENLGRYRIYFKNYPNYNHYSTVLPSISEGLQLLVEFISKNPYQLKNDFKEITIKVTVQNKNDEIFIAGNQESLGNWNPSKIQFKYISEKEREIVVKVKFPIEFKLTKGNWESELFTNQTGNMGRNIVINNLKTNILHLKIIE